MASVHLPAFVCRSCNRSFVSQAVLDNHLKESSAHKPSFDCIPCNKSFKSEDSLNRHLATAQVHLPSFDCLECDRKFKSQQALDAHLSNAPIHQQPQPETPVDRFFRSFPGFAYNRSLPPDESFASLRRHKRWRPKSDESKDAWDRYQRALQSEFDQWFGLASDLTAWHALCRAIGIRPLPATCAECEEAVRSMFVNIIDLIEWGRKGGKGKVQVFDDLEDLQDYTLDTRRFFNFRRDRPGSGNVVLKHLLRQIIG